MKTSLRRISRLAAITFWESARSHFFYSLLFFGLVLTATSLLAGEFTLGAYGRILRDAGTASLDFLGYVLAIYLGLSLIYRPIDRKSLHFFLATPMRRWEFVTGRLVGGLYVLTLAIASMFGVLLLALIATLGLESIAIGTMFGYLLLRISSLAIVLSIVVLASTVASPLVAGLSAVTIAIAGMFGSSVYFFASKSHDLLPRWIATVVYVLLPDLSLFDVSAKIAYMRPLDWGDIPWRLGYALGYVVSTTLAAIAIFSRKDIS